VTARQDKVGSLNGLKGAMPAIDKACGDSHELYRIRRQR
jgi:hypothetical protein